MYNLFVYFICDCFMGFEYVVTRLGIQQGKKGGNINWDQSIDQSNSLSTKARAFSMVVQQL